VNQNEADERGAGNVAREIFSKLLMLHDVANHPDPSVIETMHEHLAREDEAIIKAMLVATLTATSRRSILALQAEVEDAIRRGEYDEFVIERRNADDAEEKENE
jgi:hypothetical protein